MTPITPELRDKFILGWRHGFFWCCACNRIVDPLHQGEAQLQRCPECDSARIAFFPAVKTEDYSLQPEVNLR
jgi:hypothetical protein